MNYIILVGIAVFFLLSAIRDGAMGWDFGDGQMNFRITDGDYTLRVRGEGDVDLAPDGSGVAALSSRGSLDVRMTRGGTDRRAVFTSPDGTMERQFFVEGEEQPWGPEADRFVTEVMPLVLRETGINFEERVAWLLQNRGQNGLLDEIELIHSDFAQRLYTVEYAKAATIAPADFDRLMRIANDNMSSDFDLRTTLSQVHDEEMPIGEQFVALLAAGRSLSSDFDARTLLEHVGSRLPNTPEATAAYVDVARTISSDFDMRLALLPIVTRVELADDLVARGIAVAGDAISSDFDLRTLLAEAAPRVGASNALARAYTSAAASISSDFDHREALTALADGAELTPEGWRLLLESAASISSDFDCASLLAGIAPRLPRDAAVIAAYRATLNTISNDFDEQRAAAALLTAGVL